MQYKEIKRITRREIVCSAFPSLEGMLVGTSILNRKDIIRKDDIETGDIVFYEPIKEDK